MLLILGGHLVALGLWLVWAEADKAPEPSGPGRPDA
jgi:hypothetical protein